MPEARDFKLEVNPSLSHLSALVLRKFNAQFEFPNEVHAKIVSFLLELDKKEGSPLKSFFTLEERINFLNRYKESNEKLFKEWFNSENRFVLSSEEIEFYKEQDEILKDKDYLNKLIMERYERVLDFLKQNYPNFEKYKFGEDRAVSVLVSDLEIPIRGFVDRITPLFIEGWVVNLKSKKPAKVVLKINGKPVAEAEANIPRYGLMEQLKVNIPLGFRIYWKNVKLPDELKNMSDDYDCIIRVVEKETDIIIPGNYRNLKLGEIKRMIKNKYPHITYNWEVINKYFEFFIVDNFSIDLSNGTLTVGGLACLRKELKQKAYKIIIKTEAKEREVLWGIDSPGYAKANPNNPNAKKARFLVKSLPLVPNNLYNIYIVNNDKRYNLFYLIL